MEADECLNWRTERLWVLSSGSWNFEWRLGAGFGPAVAAQLDINNAERNLIDAAENEDFDGNPGRLSEMDALVAYLQMLGTLVDFSQYEEGYFAEFR